MDFWSGSAQAILCAVPARAQSGIPLSPGFSWGRGLAASQTRQVAFIPNRELRQKPEQPLTWRAIITHWDYVNCCIAVLRAGVLQSGPLESLAVCRYFRKPATFRRGFSHAPFLLVL